MSIEPEHSASYLISYKCNADTCKLEYLFDEQNLNNATAVTMITTIMLIMVTANAIPKIIAVFESDSVCDSVCDSITIIMPINVVHMTLAIIIPVGSEGDVFFLHVTKARGQPTLCITPTPS